MLEFMNCKSADDDPSSPNGIHSTQTTRVVIDSSSSIFRFVVSEADLMVALIVVDHTLKVGQMRTDKQEAVSEPLSRRGLPIPVRGVNLAASIIAPARTEDPAHCDPNVGLVSTDAVRTSDGHR